MSATCDAPQCGDIPTMWTISMFGDRARVANLCRHDLEIVEETGRLIMQSRSEEEIGAAMSMLTEAWASGIDGEAVTLLEFCDDYGLDLDAGDNVKDWLQLEGYLCRNRANLALTRAGRELCQRMGFTGGAA